MDGAEQGRAVLYITLSETEDEFREGAASHGWDFRRHRYVRTVPPESLLDDEQQQSLLYSSDLELGETTKRIFEVFEAVKPTRVVIDSLSEIMLLCPKFAALSAPDPGAEALFLAAWRDRADARRPDRRQNDKTMHSIAHGV
jgi:circadian clock protein KaiC